MVLLLSYSRRDKRRNSIPYLNKDVLALSGKPDDVRQALQRRGAPKREKKKRRPKGAKDLA